jgi:hypothetical protein
LSEGENSVVVVSGGDVSVESEAVLAAAERRGWSTVHLSGTGSLSPPASMAFREIPRRCDPSELASLLHMLITLPSLAAVAPLKHW